MRSLPSGLGHAKLTRRGGVTGVKDKGGRIRISEPGFVHHFYPGPPRLFRIWPLTMQLSITAGNKCGDKDHTGFGDAYSRNTDTELQTLGGARWIDRASGHTITAWMKFIISGTLIVCAAIAVILRRTMRPYMRQKRRRIWSCSPALL
jgi:hypothetical protein